MYVISCGSLASSNNKKALTIINILRFIDNFFSINISLKKARSHMTLAVRYRVNECGIAPESTTLWPAPRWIFSMNSRILRLSGVLFQTPGSAGSILNDAWQNLLFNHSLFYVCTLYKVMLIKIK
jgi:hypothetical protein